VSYADVAKVTADLLSMTREQRLAIPVMHPGRADVIGGGALVLRVIMQRAGFDAVVASEHDILDGIVTSLVAGGGRCGAPPSSRIIGDDRRNLKILEASRGYRGCRGRLPRLRGGCGRCAGRVVLPCA